MHEKLDDVLVETQNRYIRPVNCECLELTKINHLIWDKLKHGTTSSDVKLQCIQANLLKGFVPIVAIIEKLVKVQDKIPVEVLDVESLIKTATAADAVALLGEASFGLNMQCRHNQSSSNQRSVLTISTCALLLCLLPSSYLEITQTSLINLRIWLKPPK